MHPDLGRWGLEEEDIRQAIELDLLTEKEKLVLSALYLEGLSPEEVRFRVRPEGVTKIRVQQIRNSGLRKIYERKYVWL